MATIKTKTTTASFILNYISDVNLRQQIEKQLNKIELSNTFSRAVFFSNNQEFRDGSKEEQILIAICKSFMQNCIILWNYLYLSQLLINKKTLEEKEQLLKIIKANSVQLFKRLNSYAKDHYIYRALREFGRIIKSIIIGGMLIYKENMILPM